MLFYKINPKDLKVCHSCDNPSCVNPKHLFLGTQRDNMEDMINKGRGKLPPPPPRGEKNHATKLTEDKVLEIVHLYKSGEKKSDLAKRYKVTTQAIYLILKGENWNHVTKIKHVQQEGLI
jgi:DNA invertase Pin-like site-specific DNA recombinase